MSQSSLKVPSAWLIGKEGSECSIQLDGITFTCSLGGIQAVLQDAVCLPLTRVGTKSLRILPGSFSSRLVRAKFHNKTVDRICRDAVCLST